MASPMERLARAAPQSDRRVEARFSGDFRWAPLRRAEKSKRSDEEWQLEALAAEFLPDENRQHAAGVARALLGSFADAVSRLDHACHSAPANAAACNDLAAARYALAIDYDDPHRLPAALSDADRALRLSPFFPQARFNRALILTHLGIRNEALEAWRSAREVERDPAWAAEIDKNIAAFEQAAVAPLGPRLEQALQSAEADDSKPLRALVAAYPQETRTYAETRILTSWAEALNRNDFTVAERILSGAQRIGDLLTVVNGDRLLRDAVNTITAAPASGRRRLAKAHLAYRDGRVRYAAGAASSAEEIANVAEMFARERSPMEHVARYYSANAFFDSNRPEPARRLLDQVIASIDVTRYPSLAAGAEKQLGLYYGFRELWTVSLTHLERSRTLFATRGERVNAAFVGAIAGEASDLTGDFEQGWRHRIAALDVLTRSAPDQRSVSVLIGAVDAETMRGDYESALSLVQVARHEATLVGVPALTAAAIRREARVLLHARGVRDAEAALLEAKGAAASMSEKRARTEAEIAIVEAAIARRSDPERAVATVTPAITFFRTHGLGILLPAAYLERGRAHRARGARADARADFEEGLRSIERQRDNVDMQNRTTLYDTVPELTDELVDLLLEKKEDQPAAFAAVERARARTLIEALGVAQKPGSAGIANIAAALPDSAIFIEYALLPDDVAAFCVGPGGLTVRRLGVKPAQLRRSVAELRARIENRHSLGDVQRAGAELYAALFRPLELMIAGADTLYLGPDRFLNALPFAALYDGRQFLIEKQRLILAPSGTFLLGRPRLRRELRPALIIADPTSSAGGSRLDAARTAALELKKLYDAPAPLVGPDATVERFKAAAPESALIHYAGHAHSDETAGGFLPLAPSRGVDGRLDATEISRLSLRKTNLVVLSACATMRGDVTRVEGMPSLSRAFLRAGAQAVIGMLWEIDDEATAQLLRPFHQRLRRGMPPSQALREAQIEMLRSRHEEHMQPIAWAAAELLGAD
ncbi:MAG TPA: CHAT domain-containing protein [Thermoanaerobaculia bacterium]|nr:CHAT domain-containing protein [Thermoanaerobaculia bacterium]